ncbi:transposase [Massiliimalia massiliensis]|uniref:transposase n=1 Tax=Massiliimalia massiliensis TaxID=1852384 RepID=UPI0009854D71|nr:transposase [Massiliimalia massiliensis]
MPKTYSEEFKQMLYQKYKSGETISSHCKAYDVSRISLYNWFSDMKPIVKSQGKMYSAGNILALQRELERLKAENEIYRISGCTPKSPLKN